MFRIPPTALGQAYVVAKSGETRAVTAAKNDELAIVSEPPLRADDLELLKPAGSEIEEDPGELKLEGVDESIQAANAAEPEVGYRLTHGRMVRCHRCNSMTSADAISCKNCGFNLAETPKPSQAESLDESIEPIAPPEEPEPERDHGAASINGLVDRARRRQIDDEALQNAYEAEAKMLDSTLPWGMLAVSIVFLALTSSLISSGITDTFYRFLISVLIAVAIYPTYLAGIFVAAHFVRQSYGDIRVVSLKLLALAFLPESAGTFVGVIMSLMFGSASQPLFFVNASRIFLGGYLFWYFVRVLFRLTVTEALTAAAVMFVVGWMVRFGFRVLAMKLGIGFP